MLYFIARAVTTLGIAICASGALLSVSAFWQLLWLALFFVFLRLHDDLAIFRWRRKNVPCEWSCPRCEQRGKPMYFGSTVADATETFQYLHNRTVHLEEL